jgi:hypothetical protein
LGLRRSVVERNFADLPEELNKEFLNKSMKGLREMLARTFGDDLDAKIEQLVNLWNQFKDGTVQPKHYCMENAVAVRLVLAELKVKRLAR